MLKNQFAFVASFACLKLGINAWFKGGMYTPHEILTSTFGMELKLELVLVLDRRRQ